MSDSEHEQEPVTVTDRRRIGPDTGEVREADTEAGVDAPASAGVDAALEDGAVEPDSSDKVAELTGDLQRLQADFANYRRRAEKERLGAAEYGKASLAEELLPVLDDLDRAREHGDLESGPLRAVADKITDTLSNQGLRAFGEAGEEFDPALHEAVQHEGDGAHPVIGTVYRKGYRLGERVLRHAMVVVTDGAAADDSAEAPAAQDDPSAPGGDPAGTS